MGEFIRISNNKFGKNEFGINNQNHKDAYVEFVPGVVLDVILNMSSPAYKEPRDINSIIAKKHLGNWQGKSMIRTKYYPLLRGLVDVPIKGDPVLLCNFGGIDYYLGPLNSINNPNFNVDPLNKSKTKRNPNTDIPKETSIKTKLIYQLIIQLYH